MGKPKKIEFLTPKQFILESEIGQGACGKTVVIYDPTINERFVCKKYSPIFDSMKSELFTNFVQEIKLLYLINHPNIVRVFNYYLYPEKLLGYIMMEYVQGEDIEEYLKCYPENVNEIFKQVVEGFSYLEENSILHRDIRPMNILVNKSGQVKIIDFGFGKQAMGSEDFQKSISLNWWCEIPSDFKDRVYDFRTEVYFIGKLFEKLITEYEISDFKYRGALKQMCEQTPARRIASFADVKRAINSESFPEIDFATGQLEAYRYFSNTMRSVISKIERSAKYHDIETLQTRLEDLYKKVMLEETIPKNNLIINCIVNGAFYYSNSSGFYVTTLKRFIDLLRSSSREKKNIILSNLQTKIDTIPRYSEESSDTNDVPF